MAKEQILKEYGLNDNEIKVYLACLKLGTSKVNEISKKANILRTTTYEVLKSLIEKGLISYIIKSGIKYFEASDPIKLINILNEKKKKIKSILPELEDIKKSVEEKPKIEIYEGKEGIKTVIDDLIKTKKPILAYGSTRKQLKLLHFYFPNYIKRRVKARIKIKILTEHSKETEEVKKRDKKELRETRFFPKSIDPPTATNIYGNKVAILSLEKELLGIIIESENIAETQRIIFDLLWKIAKK